MAFFIPCNFSYIGHAKGCGITDEVMEWMEVIQNSAIDDIIETKHPKAKALQSQVISAGYPNALAMDQFDRAFSKYTKEANEFGSKNSSQGGATFFGDPSRVRRAARSSYANSKTTCTLSIQTDPLLWRHIAEQVHRAPLGFQVCSKFNLIIC